jgi:hypothetical protein
MSPQVQQQQQSAKLSAKYVAPIQGTTSGPCGRNSFPRHRSHSRKSMRLSLHVCHAEVLADLFAFVPVCPGKAPVGWYSVPTSLPRGVCAVTAVRS